MYPPNLQQPDEWITYESCLNLTQNAKENYYDIVGNHERYGDRGWNGTYDPKTKKWYGYKHNSMYGASSNPIGEFKWETTLNGDSYLFLAANTCDEIGYSWIEYFNDLDKYGFISDLPTLSAVERKYIEDELKEFYPILNPIPQNKLSFIFGHAPIYRLVPFSLNPLGEYPLNEIGKDRGGIEFVKLLNDYNVSAYTFGHTHKDRDLYDLDSTHGITSRLMNISSLTEQGKYQIVVIDNNAVITKVAKVNNWPVVMITAPVDYKAIGLNNAYNITSINNPFSYTIKPNKDNFIRVLAFWPDTLHTPVVKYRYKKANMHSWIAEGYLKKVADAKNTWQGNWDCSTLDNVAYELEVEADSGGEKDTHRITVKVDKAECALIYPSGGEVLGGTFKVRTKIDESVLPKLTDIQFIYYDSTDNYQGIPKEYAIPYDFNKSEFKTIHEAEFNSKLNNNILNGKKIFFKVRIEIEDEELSTRYSANTIEQPVIIDNTRPKTLTNLSAKSIKNGYIELSWTSSIDDHLVGYNIYRSIDNINYSLQYDRIPVTAIYFVDNFTENRIKYSYRIKAYDLAGNESKFSNIAIATADNEPPDIIQNFTTYSSKNKLKLTWENPKDSDYSKTIVFRSETDSEDLSYESVMVKNDVVEIYNGDETSYADFPLIDGNKYFYFAFAIDQAGNYSSGVKTNGIPGRTPADYVFMIQTGKPWFDPFVLPEYKSEAGRVLEFLDADKADGDNVSLIYFSNGGVGTKTGYEVTKHTYNTQKKFWNNIRGTARGTLERLSELETTSATYVTNTDCGSCHTIENNNHPVKGWSANPPGCSGSGLCHSSAQNCVSTGLSQVDKIFKQGSNTEKHLIVFTNWYLWPMSNSGGLEPRYLSYWLRNAFQKEGYKVTGMDFSSYSESDYYRSRSSYFWNARDLKNVFEENGWRQYLRTKENRLTDDEWRSILNRNWNLIVAMNSPWINKGEKYTQGVPVNSGDGEVKIIVRNDNGLLNKLYYPNGEEVNHDYDPNVIYLTQGVYDVYRMPVPEKGIWQIICDGENIAGDSTKIEVEALVSKGIELIVNVPEESEVGGKIKIKALVVKGDSTETIKSVKFKIEGTDKYVELYDDSFHGDNMSPETLAKSDGYFANDFLVGTLEGKYLWKMELSGKDKNGYKILREQVGEINIKGNSPMVTYLSPVGMIVEESPQIEFNISDDGMVDLSPEALAKGGNSKS